MFNNRNLETYIRHFLSFLHFYYVKFGLTGLIFG